MVFSPMLPSTAVRYGVRKSGWLALLPVKTPPEARLEDRGDGQVVHGRSYDDYIGSLDFLNKRFGKIQRAS
jgi:hypothetical protein